MPTLALMKEREHHTCRLGVHDIRVGVGLNNDAFDVTNGHFMYGCLGIRRGQCGCFEVVPRVAGKLLSEGNVLVNGKCSRKKASLSSPGREVVLDNNNEVFQCLRTNLNSGACIISRAGNRWGRGHG
jgi:hypothetical protein